MNKPVVLHLSVSEASWVVSALQVDVKVLRKEASMARRVGNEELAEWWDGRAEVVDRVRERLEAEVEGGSNDPA